MRRSLVLGSWILPLFLVGATAGADEPAFLGVKFGPIPEALAAHLKDAHGAVIDEVVPGSPADKAGLKRFDVVGSIDGKALGSPDEFRARILGMKPGEAVKLGVVRGMESMTIEAKLGAVPAALPAPKPEGSAPAKPANHRAFLGVGVSDVPSALAYQLRLEDRKGALVGEVVKGSPAQKAGIEKNDVVTALDGQAVDGSHGFIAALRGKKPGDEVKVDYLDKGEKKTAAVKLGEWPKELSGIHGAPRRWAFPGGGSWFGMPHPGRGGIILGGPDGPEGSVHLPGMTSLGSESGMAIIRSVDGEYDITVRDRDGVRTVTVLKDGKSIAEDLPWDKLDTLSPDVRERVQVTAGSLKVGPMPGRPAEGEEPGIKA